MARAMFDCFVIFHVEHSTTVQTWCGVAPHYRVVGHCTAVFFHYFAQVTGVHFCKGGFLLRALDRANVNDAFPSFVVVETKKSWPFVVTNLMIRDNH